MKKRLLAVLLAALMVSPTLVSCSENQQNSDEAPSAESTENTAAVTAENAAEEIVIEEEKRPNHSVPETLDYDGRSFTIAYPEWQGYLFYFFADEQTGEAMNDAIYARKIKVEDCLNTKLSQEKTGNYASPPGAIRKVVNSGDDVYQMCLLHCIDGVADLASGGYLYDFDKLPYIDQEAEWWNKTQMDVLRLGKRTYYGVSDYMIPCPYVVYFNNDIVTDKNLGNPYEMVYNGQWTMDAMFEIAKGAVEDTNGDGKYDIDNDIIGIGCDESSKFSSFMTSAGQNMTSRDEEGKVFIDMNSERMITIVEKMYSIASVEGAVLDLEKPDNTCIAPFASGHFMYILAPISSATLLRDAEIDVGILPYPKLDEAQENYTNLDWGGLMCVPTTIQDPEFVSAVIELLSYYSNDGVISAYYDITLDGKIARNEDSIAMLDIIFDTITYEVGMNYFGFNGGTGDLFWTMYRLCVRDQSTDWASWYKKSERVANGVLKGFYKKLDKTEATD